MTDLRITDPVDQAMIRDIESDRPTGAPRPMLTDEQIEALKRLGFDHVPTVDELAERKAQRQAEVRDEVLFQADRKYWCDDGTRKVCANLRIARPGGKTERKVTYRVTMDVEVRAHTWTERGALAYAINSNLLPTDGGSYGGTGTGTATNVVIEGLAVDGTPFELTDDLRKEMTHGV